MAAKVNHRFPDELVPRIKFAHDFALYVWGVVSYRDVFGVPHKTTFAQQIYWKPLAGISEDGFIPESVQGIYLGRHNRSN